ATSAICSSRSSTTPAREDAPAIARAAYGPRRQKTQSSSPTTANPLSTSPSSCTRPQTDRARDSSPAGWLPSERPSRETMRQAGRQARVEIGVVRALHLQVRIRELGLVRGERVLDGRVDLQRNALLQTVVDHRRDEGAVGLELRLPLDHRGDDHRLEVADAER